MAGAAAPRVRTVATPRAEDSRTPLLSPASSPTATTSPTSTTTPSTAFSADSKAREKVGLRKGVKGRTTGPRAAGIGPERAAARMDVKLDPPDSFSKALLGSVSKRARKRRGAVAATAAAGSGSGGGVAESKGGEEVRTRAAAPASPGGVDSEASPDAATSGASPREYQENLIALLKDLIENAESKETAEAASVIKAWVEKMPTATAAAALSGAAAPPVAAPALEGCTAKLKACTKAVWAALESAWNYKIPCPCCETKVSVSDVV